MVQRDPKAHQQPHPRLSPEECVIGVTAAQQSFERVLIDTFSMT
jgi:hypothetical protein